MSEEQLQVSLGIILPAGTILYIRWGDADNEITEGPLRLLQRTTRQKLAEDYKREWPDYKRGTGNEWDEVLDDPQAENFAQWLLDTRRAEHMHKNENVQEWHVGVEKFWP